MLAKNTRQFIRMVYHECVDVNEHERKDLIFFYFAFEYLLLFITNPLVDIKLKNYFI